MVGMNMSYAALAARGTTSSTSSSSSVASETSAQSTVPTTLTTPMASTRPASPLEDVEWPAVGQSSPKKKESGPGLSEDPDFIVRRYFTPTMPFIAPQPPVFPLAIGCSPPHSRRRRKRSSSPLLAPFNDLPAVFRLSGIEVIDLTLPDEPVLLDSGGWVVPQAPRRWAFGTVDTDYASDSSSVGEYHSSTQPVIQQKPFSPSMPMSPLPPELPTPSPPAPPRRFYRGGPRGFHQNHHRGFPRRPPRPRYQPDVYQHPYPYDMPFPPPPLAYPPYEPQPVSPLEYIPSPYVPSPFPPYLGIPPPPVDSYYVYPPFPPPPTQVDVITESVMKEGSTFVSPPMSPSALDLQPSMDVMANQLRHQLEYYLSEANLARDVWLRRKMDSKGFIPLSLLTTFNRVKTVLPALLSPLPTSHLQQQAESLVFNLLSTSPVVELAPNQDGQWFVRPRHNWSLWIIPEHVPPPIPSVGGSSSSVSDESVSTTDAAQSLPIMPSESDKSPDETMDSEDDVVFVLG